MNVCRHSEEEGVRFCEQLVGAPLDRPTDVAGSRFAKLLAGRPRLVESAVEAREPHRLARVQAAATRVASGLEIMGVTPAEEMC